MARDFRLDVQTQFDCTFFSNLREGSISCWCSPGKAFALKQHLQEHQERLRNADLHNVEEELLAGNTRAVYGLGGQVAMMLFHDEVLSVNVLGLPSGTAPDDLKMSFEKYGPVRVLRTSVMAHNGSLFSQATFMRKQHAKLALEQYDRDCTLTCHTITFSVGGSSETRSPQLSRVRPHGHVPRQVLGEGCSWSRAATHGELGDGLPLTSVGVSFKRH